MCCLATYSYGFVGFFFFFKQKTAYEMRISDWSSDVCSSDLEEGEGRSSASSSFPRLVFGRFSPSCYRGAAQRSAGGAGEVDIQYPDEFIDRLHLIWGDAFLSPGGPEEVRAIVSGLDLEDGEVLDIGCGTGGPAIDRKSTRLNSSH